MAISTISWKLFVKLCLLFILTIFFYSKIDDFHEIFVQELLSFWRIFGVIFWNDTNCDNIWFCCGICCLFEFSPHWDPLIVIYAVRSITQFQVNSRDSKSFELEKTFATLWTFSHCSKSSFFVQKFNFDFPRKLSIF